MPGPFRDLQVLSPDAPVPGFTRRRFLAGLGVLAAGTLCAPLLSRVRIGRVTSVEFERAGLGTWIRIVARSDDPARAERAIERAFAAIDLVDRQMSVHRADSQLARVNRAAGIGPVAVDDAVLEVVGRARWRAERAGGVYDPTVLPLMRLHGFYGAARERYPSDREIAHALDAVGWRHVLVDRAAGTLGLARRGAGLDLGSIGKGWAVDQAVAALRDAGITSGLVDVGRNVYGLGTPGGRASGSHDGWPVGVVHPASGAIDRIFTLRDQAVATSGNAEQHHRLGGVTVGHLLDARRGRPADGPLSATVLARTGTDADGISTVAFLLGAESVRAWPEPLAVHVIA
jgi:thiamine biosynthesis lipoprotein